MTEHKKPRTPIVSETQRGFFGAELARLRAGKKRKTDMTEAQLVTHLRDVAGKDLPRRVHHSALAAAAHKRLAGVEMRDVAQKREEPKMSPVHYPSFSVPLEKVPELKGKQVGDIIVMAVEARVRSVHMEGEGDIGSACLEILSAGLEKAGKEEEQQA